MNPYVQTKIESSLATILLDRPDKRNALRRDFIEQLVEAVDQIVANPDVRVLVLRASGSVFCAGMDLKEMQSRATSESGKSEWQRDSEVYAELLSKLYGLEIPTIVALQGPVLAGGVGMVLACDFIVAAESSFIMLPEPMRGITAAMVTPFLVNRIGAGPATQLLLSGQKMPAERAYQLGLVYELTTDHELSNSVNKLAQSVLTGSKSALAITKRHVKNCSPNEVVAMLADSIRISAEARETADAREGLAAFLEKRKPNWQPAE